MHDRPSERGVMRRLVTPARWLVAVAALIGIAVALWQLQRGESGLRITTATVGETPVTVYRPQAEGPAPVVVIAHGFAGSQQLMQPFAVTLAQNGYVAVTFDFTGHGRNPVPMKGDVNEPTRITGVLVDELGRVADYAKTLPGTDGRLAVLGHSMASDIVVRYAMAHPEVTATVAVSVFSPVATASSPRNLLVIVGALEPNMLINEGLRIVNLATGGGAVAGQSYGDFADGSARRLALSSGVEHIGVLYSRDSMAESLQWLNQAFGHQGSGFLDRRPPWLALLFGALIALAWPLSRLLPKAAEAPMGANLRWKPLLAAAIVPALLTPLILWKMPTDFLIILLGDYLTLHFLVYGVLTALILRFGNRGKPLAGQTLLWPGQSRPRLADKAVWKPGAPNSITAQASLTYVAIAAMAVGAYNIIAIGLPLDRYVFSFHPIAPRIHLILAVACGTVPYFITAEWLTRGDARRGAYALTKFCFLASLAIAVALNLYKLFFLIIIVPAILLLFLAFGLISHWSYKATNHPLPGALANAAVFAWAIAVTFPMVIR